MSAGSDRRTVLLLGLTAAAGILVGLVYFQTHPPDLNLSAAGKDASSERAIDSRLERLEEPGSRRADLRPDQDGLSRSVARLETGRGVMRFRCASKAAPRTCKRIAELISHGFYNGLIFHRVIPGFAIQAGDPTGTGSGGSGELLPLESNSLRHEEGSIGLAHESYDPNSGDSQFYITLSPQPHLDGKYTIFGNVIEGIEVARKIEKGDRIISLRWE